MVHNYCIIVAGPTAVGKTDFARLLSVAVDGEVINGDQGQFYVPLTIGTAKPNYSQESVAHHLFDIINKPIVFSVMEFRRRVKEICAELWQNNKLPIIVGGSSYYIASLFFPPVHHEKKIVKQVYTNDKNLWQLLHSIDQERAKEIDVHDIYRIKRALDIWYSVGVKPSMYKPQYDPLANKIIFIWLERDREELYRRINKRVDAMVQAGFIEEVKALVGTGWESFLLAKKIIGYPEVIAYCRGAITQEAMIAAIQQKTRNYAKRQITFWRSFQKKLLKEFHQKIGDDWGRVKQVNLTHEPIARYIKQLSLWIKNNMTGNNIDE